MPHKTSAWPLGMVYAGLVIYASLYPFTDWRDQGPLPWGYLLAPWPHYWTAFDLFTNVLGYAPLGFLFALAALRTGLGAQAVLRATLGAGALSLCLETLQGYLPARVPSNVDWVLNTAGAWLGAVSATLLEKYGAIDRWIRFRERWFVADARGALVLLALWPFALLFPAAVPLGLGQVYERVEEALAGLLLDTPFLEWVPLRTVELQPLVPGAELACVLLGALIPCLLGYSVIPAMARRIVFVAAVFVAALGASLLSATLSYGPVHAWAWFSRPVQAGLLMALVLALLLLRVPARAGAALLLLLLGVYLSLINRAPASPYFAHTLQIWEQGRFIRFHGVGQWLGWIWPYAVLLYVLTRIWGQGRSDEGAPKIGP
ncbi:MAG TPA: VanZ family protein [Curvibacter sp.]|nr:VanZ family protein [Curvibacter sp.]